MSRLTEYGSFIAREPMQDTQLLEEFVKTRSPQTFTAIVQRYSGMVYASALRQVGQGHLAEEIAQCVFVDLWRSASSLKPGAVLVGWLLTATRYRAANAVRLRRRRQYHEKQAAQLRKDSVSEAGQVWLDEVTPHLDAALASLSNRNRQALLLRFFEGASMQGISQRLCISEDAAKQRVSRSMEQLRIILHRRGVVMPAAVLPQILASQANLPPVAGLVHSTLAALQSSVPKGVVITMAASKVKAAVAAGVVLALLGGGTAVAWKAAGHATPRTIVIDAHPAAGDWMARFNQVYGLSADQQVKYIPPPFIPERNLIWHYDNNESLTVEYSGASIQWRGGTLASNLGWVLSNVAGIQPSELDASVPRSMPLEGDWSVRKGAPVEQIVKVIAAVVSQKLGRTVHFERRNVIRDTIIVRGTYHFVPLAGKPDDGVIDLIGDPPPFKVPSRISHITLGELLTGMSDVNGLAILDETGQSKLKVTVADHPTWGKPESILHNVAAQTSLRFEHEPRPRDMWFMVDATTGK